MTPPHAPVPELLVVRDLKSQGLAGAEIRTLRKEQERVRRGVFVPHWPVDLIDRHLVNATAVLAVHGPGTALTHQSAAAAHGLPLWDLDLHDVHVVGSTRAKRRRGIKYHWYPAAPPVSHANGMAVTDLAQTVWDCARTLRFETAVVLGDAALHTGLVAQQDLWTAAARYPRVRGRGRAARVIRALDPKSESPGESRSRLLVVAFGYPVESQYSIQLDDGTVVRSDLRIKGTRVLVEFDGRAKYQGDDAHDVLWREKLRSDSLSDLGWEIVRLTWADLAHPALVARIIRRAIERTR